MSYDLRNALVNNVLCFITTSRNTLNHDEIVSSVVAFYNAEKIKEAKEIIFKLLREKVIVRKTCDKHPNPSVPNVKDILKLLSTREIDALELPSFLCDGYNAMPPRGFSDIAGMICDLRDEIAAFRHELHEHRRERTLDIKSLEDLSDTKEDITDTKRMINEVKNNVGKILTEVSGRTAPNDIPINNNSQTINPPLSGPHVPTMADIVKNNRPIHKVLAGPVKPPLKRGVFGTRKSSPSNKISGVVRNLDVFVGRCTPETTNDDVISYCLENGAEVVKCEKINGKSPNSTSFKLTVSANIRDQLLDPGFWPEDIVVRKFYTPKKVQSPRRLSIHSTNALSQI